MIRQWRWKPELADAHAGKGDALVGLGRFDEAMRCYEEAIRLEPDLAEAHAGKGYALVRLGRFDEAIKCYDEAVRLET